VIAARVTGLRRIGEPDDGGCGAVTAITSRPAAGAIRGGGELEPHLLDHGLVGFEVPVHLAVGGAARHPEMEERSDSDRGRHPHPCRSGPRFPSAPEGSQGM
jgi:hypothetical protein